MKSRDVFPAWWRILQGRRPFLSVEITKECPLRCPGCYAYSDEHLESGINLRQLSDYRGPELVERVVRLVEDLRPIHLSIVGGEPLVRYRELGEILPRISRLNVEVQLVTSAVRPIPREWAGIRNLHVVVSVDGLPQEHDRRRAPATYERILKNIAGHVIIVHCTITRQLCRPGYLREFCDYWSARPEARKIWFSLFTPQEGDESPERLTPADRWEVLRELAALRSSYPKLQLPESALDGFRRPPHSPGECVFSRVTTCLTADLETTVGPCQFGGKPVCAECGCIAAAGLTAVSRIRLGGLVPLSAIFAASEAIGRRLAPAPAPQVAEEAPDTVA